MGRMIRIVNTSSLVIFECRRLHIIRKPQIELKITASSLMTLFRSKVVSLLFLSINSSDRSVQILSNKSMSNNSYSGNND